MTPRTRIMILFMVIFPLGIVGILLLNPRPIEYEVLELEEFTINGISIRYMSVEGFKFKYKETVIYIDPYDVRNVNSSILETADFILITHNHVNHESPSDISFLSNENTTLITYNNEGVEMGSSLTFGDFTFEFVPAYNVNKYINGTNQLIHPPEVGWMGFILEINNTRIYHAGDTDRIPEMANLDVDIALLPVSGVGWMTPEEAAKAVKDLKIHSKLSYAIPTHYTGTSGSEAQAIRFSKLASCNVIILEDIYSWGWKAD